MSKIKETKVSAQVVIESIGKQTDKTFRTLSAITSIKTHEEFNRAGELVKSLKEIVKVAEEQRAKIVNPLKEAVKAVDEHFKPFYKKVEENETRIKEEMKKFLASNQKKLLKLEERVSSGKIKNISTFVTKAAKLSVDSDSVSTRKVWKAIIVDENKIPRKFLSPDTQSIVEHLRKGGAPIPGVEWKQVDSIAI